MELSTCRQCPSHGHGSQIRHPFAASWVDRALEAASLSQSRALHGRCCSFCHRCNPWPSWSQDPRTRIAWSSPCHRLKGQWCPTHFQCAQMGKSCQENTHLWKSGHTSLFSFLASCQALGSQVYLPALPQHLLHSQNCLVHLVRLGGALHRCVQMCNPVLVGNIRLSTKVCRASWDESLL